MNVPMPPEIAAVFEAFPPDIRKGMMGLRQMIFRVADEIPGVGPIEEALRWGQPSYLTSQTRSGSTIRLGAPKTGGFALYVNCQTTLMDDFRPIAPANLKIEGRRAVVFQVGDEVDATAIEFLIQRALTYHRKGLFVG